MAVTFVVLRLLPALGEHHETFETVTTESVLGALKRQECHERQIYLEQLKIVHRYCH